MSSILRYRISVVGLVLLLTVAVFRVVDLASAIDDHEVEYGHLREELSLVHRLASDLGRQQSRDAIRKMLAANYSSHLIANEGELIFVDSVGLRFKDNQLVEVVSMNVKQN